MQAQKQWRAADAKEPHGLLLRAIDLYSLLTILRQQLSATGLPPLPQMLLSGGFCRQASAWSFGASNCVPYQLQRYPTLVLVADASKLWPWVRALYSYDGSTSKRCMLWRTPASEAQQLATTDPMAFIDKLTEPTLLPNEIGVLQDWNLDWTEPSDQALLTGTPWTKPRRGSTRPLPADKHTDVKKYFSTEKHPKLVDLFPDRKGLRPLFQRKPLQVTKLREFSELFKKDVDEYERARFLKPFPHWKWKEWLQQTNDLRREMLLWREQRPKARSWMLDHPECSYADGSSGVYMRPLWNNEVSLFVPPVWSQASLALSKALKEALLGIAILSPDSLSKQSERIDSGAPCNSTKACSATFAEGYCSDFQGSLNPKHRKKTYRNAKEREARRQVLNFETPPSVEMLEQCETAANYFARIWKMQTGRALTLWQHKLPSARFLDAEYEKQAQSGELRFSEFFIKQKPVAEPNEVLWLQLFGNSS